MNKGIMVTMTKMPPWNERHCVMNISCVVSFASSRHTIMTATVFSVFRLSEIYAQSPVVCSANAARGERSWDLSPGLSDSEAGTPQPYLTVDFRPRNMRALLTGGPGSPGVPTPPGIPG